MIVDDYYLRLSRFKLAGFERRQRRKQKSIKQILMPAGGAKIADFKHLMDITYGGFGQLQQIFKRRILAKLKLFNAKSPRLKRVIIAGGLISAAVVTLLIMVLASAAVNNQSYARAHSPSASGSLAFASGAKPPPISASGGQVKFSFVVRNASNFRARYQYLVLVTSDKGTTVVDGKKLDLAAASSSAQQPENVILQPSAAPTQKISVELPGQQQIISFNVHRR
ncbi:MAG: hypothetical protein ACREGA_01665 [Candidatus Saccharimonadales bacterium]